MNPIVRTLVRIALAGSFAWGIACAPASAPHVASAQAGKHYVCPACGASCDSAVYDHPGTCPQCGMTLVESGPPAAEKTHGKRVAILLFEGAEIIDFTGPWEVFGAVGFDVYTVAATKEPISTAMGMTVVPHYTFADAPPPDVLLVPGGGVSAARKDPATLRWVAETSHQAQQTLSVCNGAFIVAGAGLLDGLTATTTYGRLAELRAAFPKVTVVADRRYVDNGAIVTAAGLSSGIDGALHVVDKMLGRGAAQEAALDIEYDWHPEGGFVRAQLADHVLPEVDLSVVGSNWVTDRTEGSTDRWDVTARGTSSRTPGEVLDVLDRAFVAKGTWKRTATGDASRGWTLEEAPGARWAAAATIAEPARGSGPGTYRLDVAVRRVP